MMTRELGRSPHVSSVVAVDNRPDVVDACVTAASSATVHGAVLDLSKESELVDVLQDCDLAVAALPHALSPLANRAAVAARTHLIDLVGSGYLAKKREFSQAALEAGVLLLTGCGVAPGLVSVLAARGIELLDEADEAVMYCGGLPRHPQPPLWYQVVYRLESVMGLYTRPATALVDGRVLELPALSGHEACRFGEPVGECEAVLSDAHSPVYTQQGKVKRIFEKTVRHLGHFAKMSVLAELGFLDDAPVQVDGHGISPRAVSMAVLEPTLKGGSDEDVTVVRAVVEGTKDGRPVRHEWEMVDLSDPDRGYSSMAKTTGFPAVIVAEWLAEGRISERGFLTPEEILVGSRFEPFLEALRRRGVEVVER